LVYEYEEIKKWGRKVLLCIKGKIKTKAIKGKRTEICVKKNLREE
jgi:hypothetical protein